MRRRESPGRSKPPFHSKKEILMTNHYPLNSQRCIFPSFQPQQMSDWTSTNVSDSRKARRYHHDYESSGDNASELLQDRWSYSLVNVDRRHHRFDENRADLKGAQKEKRQKSGNNTNQAPYILRRNHVPVDTINTFGVVSDEEEMGRRYKSQPFPYRKRPHSHVSAAQVMASLGTYRKSHHDNFHGHETDHRISSFSYFSRNNQSIRKDTDTNPSNAFSHHSHRSSISTQYDKRLSTGKSYHNKSYSRKTRHSRNSSRSSSYQNRHLKHRAPKDDSVSSSSDRATDDIDDTYGHFHGGPGSIIAQRYQIIKDIGLGTFGRVVRALDMKRGSLNNNSNYLGRRNSHSPPVNMHRYYDNSDYSRQEPTYRSRSRERKDSSRDTRMNPFLSSYSSTNKDLRSNAKQSKGCSGISEQLVLNNHECSNFDGSYVAIKIIRNIKRYYTSAQIEADILQDVNCRGGRGQSLCVMLLNRFALSEGHYCLVFECLGPSLYDFMKKHNYQPFPLYCIQDFAAQVLDALDFLHGFGLVHTDLKPENILLLNYDEAIYTLSTGRYKNDAGYTSSSVQRVPSSTRIKLIDFGGATYDDEKKSSVVNTRQYRAPEVILGLGWSFPSDLWSLGCILPELFVGDLLFPTHDNVEHLALIEKRVGRFPSVMLNRSENYGTNAFDKYGYHKLELPAESLTLVQKCETIENLIMGRDKTSGSVGLISLLRSLLTIDPKMRVTASEAKQCPLFAVRL